VIENVIVVDSVPASDSSNSGFYLTGHAPPPDADGNKFLGIIALNNKGIGFYLDCPGAVCNGNQLHDAVIWGTAEYTSAILGGTCTGFLIDHSTLATAGRGDGYRNDACSGATITNTAVYGNKGFGLTQGGTGSTSANHNGYFNNLSGARNNISAGTGDLTSNPGFLYITRIEASSPYHGAGTTGDIGANVVKRYQDGVLTSVDLWPWPNETRIKKDMCTDAGVSTGFCGSSSLTSYVWSYLGNPNPYSGTTPPNPPAAPGNVRIIR